MAKPEADFVAIRTRVKFCGMTRLEDALAAADAGADAVGFIFYAKSPRYIEPEKAGKIAEKLPPFVNRVGVFVDAALDEIERTVTLARLTAVQLHGSESVEFCAGLRQRMPLLTLLKAFRVGETSSAADFVDYNDVVDAFLLDTFVKGEKGGTGHCFNWELVQKLQLARPFFLAGGLNRGNVVPAMMQLGPYGLDLNSGVESAPGVKIQQEIVRVMLIVREVNREADDQAQH
ncbi:MAG: phosphoribosylanthranilate isomerase [Desulforhopalus sp.]|nr:phosphoribosylanthranilate isomerase [Desulforhopalus sp.]